MNRAAALRRMDSYRANEELPPADQYGESESRWSSRNSFQRPSGLGYQEVGFPWRTALVAVFLFALGATFITLGAAHFWHHDRSTAAAFMAIGLVSFLPGSYASFMLVQALRGVPGYRLDEIAHWDDYRW